MFLKSEYEIYHPKAYQIMANEDGVDVDGSSDGDYFVCPEHQEVIIYIMGTHFWESNGGDTNGGWSTVTVVGYCNLCRKHYNIVCGSYGG